jgi:hypothetical protein
MEGVLDNDYSKTEESKRVLNPVALQRLLILSAPIPERHPDLVSAAQRVRGACPGFLQELHTRINQAFGVVFVDCHVAELRSCQQLFHLNSPRIALSSPGSNALFEVAINLIAFGMLRIAYVETVSVLCFAGAEGAFRAETGPLVIVVSIRDVREHHGNSFFQHGFNNR